MHRRRLVTAFACVLAVCCLGPSPGVAAEMEPLVVFSCAGYQRLADDLAALGATAKSPQLPAALAKFLSRKSGVAALDGLDAKRPIGAVVLTDGLAVVPIAFIPVNDAAKLLASLEKLIGQPQPQKNGIWKIGQRTATGFVRQHGGWAFLAQSEDHLERLPDPEKLLGDLPRRFDAAVEVHWQRMPEVFRTLAVDFTRLALRNNLPRRDSETEAAHELRRQLATWRFRGIEQLLMETRQLTLGWNLDERTKQAALDLRLAAMPGSALERQIATLQKGQTRFAALAGDDWPLSMHLNWLLDERQAKELAAGVRTCRDAAIRRAGELAEPKTVEERRTIESAAASAWDVLEKRLRAGHLDVAVAARTAGDGPLTLVAAARGDAKSLHDALRALSPRENGNPSSHVRLNIDAASFSPERQKLVARLLGDDPQLLMTIVDEELWAAAGKNALPALKKNLMHDKRDNDIAPLQLRLRLGALAEVAGRTTGAAWLAALRGQIGEADDRMTLIIRSDPAGLHAQLVAHEGVLRVAAIGLAAALFFGG
jgi:hypothetical protein